MIDTSCGVPISERMLSNYFHKLVNRFFKILPMREEEWQTLGTYIDGLRVELLGCEWLVNVLGDDADYLSLVSILQYLMKEQEAPVNVVKREVFTAISICNKLEERYAEAT